jgi:hypothetical protein
MSRPLSRRLTRLEAAEAAGRVVALFLKGRSPGDVDAEKARRIRTGDATERDSFFVIRTIYEERYS